jgi:predicted GIY-YIG superfamily endonuclease
VSNRYYIGYTIDFSRRLKQHNGIITGGAKRTQKGRPWYPICQIKGFYDSHSALRFEFRLQHARIRTNCMDNILKILDKVICKGDGVLQWPFLTILWYQQGYHIQQSKINNEYIIT